MKYSFRVRTGYGKPGKSWNFIISFSRPEIEVWVMESHGKSWKSKKLSENEQEKKSKVQKKQQTSLETS